MRAGRRAYRTVPVVVVTVRFYFMYKTRVGACGLLFNDHKNSIHRSYYIISIMCFFPTSTLSDRLLYLYKIAYQFVCSVTYIIHYCSLKIEYRFCVPRYFEV